MEQAGVGALVVLDGEAPVGIVTDRDLVRRVLAKNLPADGRVDSVMSAPLLTVDADADVHEVFAFMRSHAVRRYPVVRGERFVGMLSVDDLFVHLAADLADLVRPVTGQVVFAQRDSQLPAVPA
jgi:CBS domain-containing protein